jgi:D-glycero-D-manno-heptose 1,7-bisphosphate phosphatase
MAPIAAFLDRDGTLNQEAGYLNHVDRMKLIDGAGDAVALLNRHGLKTIVVTNQAGVARGYFPERLLPLLHDRLKALLKEHGATLDAIYYCPHHPDVGEPPYRQDCDCRKPKLGMIRRAQREFTIDVSRSYLVGDKISDVAFGKRAGCKAILVLTGYGKGEWEYKRDELNGDPDYIAEDILDAAQWIVDDLKAQGLNP